MIGPTGNQPPLFNNQPLISGKEVPSSTQARFQEIDKIVDAFARDTGLQGIVTVRIGDSLYTKEVGYPADRLFPICSITKTFTAAAVLRLVDQKKLSLDAKVTDFIDDPRGIFKDVTVRELLTHTSGIPDLTPERISFKKSATYEQIYESLDVNQKRPGKGQEHYNNFGFVTLAKVIEKVTGLSYENAMEQEVFRPLGISAQAPMSIDKMPEYFVSNPFEKPFVQDSPEVRIGAGNIYCSAKDLIVFERALSSKNGAFLSPSSKELLYKSHMGFDHQPFEEPFREKNIEVRGKAGAMGDPSRNKPTISTALYSIPEKDICIVVLSNKELAGNPNWAADLGEQILHTAIPL